MDWNGILGIVIALGIITLVFCGAQPLMDFLERFFERSKTQDDLEQVTQTLKARKTPMPVLAPSATPGKWSPFTPAADNEPFSQAAPIGRAATGRPDGAGLRKSSRTDTRYH